MMIRKLGAFSLVLVCSLLLSACGDKAPPASGTAATATASKQDSDKGSDAAWQKKANAYIEYTNNLGAFTSPRTQFEKERLAKDASAAAAGDYKKIRLSGIHHFNSNGLERANRVLAMGGNLPEADAAMKKLIEASEKLVPTWQTLLDYNSAKKYEDDNGAKGKELLAAYLEGMKNLMAAIEDLNREVDVLSKKIREQQLNQYRTEGKLLELNMLLALESGEKIIDTFSAAEDLKNSKKIETANAELAKMEAALEVMKTELAKRRETLKNDASRYDSVISQLNSLAGKYRESRKDPKSFNGVVNAYNDAIRSSNNIRGD